MKDMDGMPQKTVKKIPELIEVSEVKIKRALDVLNCPVCETRRLKQIEAQKRYREKRGIRPHGE